MTRRPFTSINVDYGRTPPLTPPLATCRACGATGYTRPVDWHELPGDHWSITTRCAECDTQTTRTAAHTEVEAYDRHLTRATNQVAATLERWERYRMVSDCRILTAALRAGAIEPVDFGWAP